VLIRHSKSCSNLLRNNPKTEEFSQQIRDPALTAIGAEMADAYGPLLAHRLKMHDIHLENAIIGASELRRAQETAKRLFKGHRIITLPYFTEQGEIPENTPAYGATTKPDWKRLVAWLPDRFGANATVIAVGHGSYLRSVLGVRRLANLDCVIINLEPDTGKITLIKRLNYTGPINPQAGVDKCIAARDTQKIAAHVKMQRAGGYVMPASFFKPGADMSNTRSDPTGLEYDAYRKLDIVCPQAGGFTPSLMSGFAANGLRFVVPPAAYLAYKNFSRKKTKVRSTRRRSHHRLRSKRATVRHR